MLLANQQVGYSVARVATDLRLALIRALLRTRWEYHVHAPLGAFANAVASEASRASNAYLQATSILMLLIQAAVYAIVACLVSWQATLVALLAGARHRLRSCIASSACRAAPACGRRSSAGRCSASSPTRCKR